MLQTVPFQSDGEYSETLSDVPQQVKLVLALLQILGELLCDLLNSIRVVDSFSSKENIRPKGTRACCVAVLGSSCTVETISYLKVAP